MCCKNVDFREPYSSALNDWQLEHWSKKFPYVSKKEEMGPRIEIEQYRRDFFLSWHNLKWQQMPFGKVNLFLSSVKGRFFAVWTHSGNI